MNKSELMREIEAAVDAAMSQRMYGKTEIEWRAGYPTFIRTLQEKKLDTNKTETRDGQTNYQR